MTARVFIDGAEDTTGLEIRDRLAARDDIDLIVLDEAHRKDFATRRDAIKAADIVLLCLPDAAAREAVMLIDNVTTRVIDASSAHRVADGWTYGFAELGFDVANARFVSNPGCYPTGFLALVGPLVRAGLIPRDWPLTVNAVSGYSGGGKALIARFGENRNIAWRGYGYDLAHKHVPEMQRHAGLAHAPIFAPAVIDAFRGMVVEVPLHLAALPDRPTAAALHDVLAEFFAGQPLVSVTSDTPGELLLRRDAPASDRLDLHVIGAAGDAQARLVARLDNLGKGASGAAVQNLNLMLGAEPTTGLAF